MKKNTLLGLFIIYIFLIKSIYAQEYWAKRIGGSYHDEGVDISIDAKGNTYTTGYFSDVARFGVSGFSVKSGGDTDVFLSKIDLSGNPQWMIRAGGLSVDQGLAVSTDLEENSFVTGFFSAIAQFDGKTITSRGAQDILLQNTMLKVYYSG